MSSPILSIFRLFAAGILAVTLAGAESATPAPEIPRNAARMAEAMSAHGIWYSRDVYLPFYADEDLVNYLAGVPTDRLVLPVYCSDVLAFRRGRYIFVSTGLILRSHNEQELLSALAPSAGGSSESAARFQEMQLRLAERAAAYAEATRPQLRRR